jgi:diguanylate cyclase (GGDEF)-like protein
MPLQPRELLLQRPHQAVARQCVLGALAIAVFGAGIVLALRSMDGERELRTRYGQTLELAHTALQAAQLASDLRGLQTTMARSLDGSLPASAAPQAPALMAATAELKARTAELAQLVADLGGANPAAEIDSLLAGTDRLNTQLAAASERGALPQPSARALVAQADSQLHEFDVAITRLVADARNRTMAADLLVSQSSKVAQIGLLAFSGMALLLGLSLAVLMVRTTRANRGLVNELQLVARQDPLTGVTNRRGLSDTLTLEFARAARSAQPLAVVMIDLDHFKRYNDRRGHGAGDVLLREAAQAWQKALRPTDLLARYGGEEFTLVLPGCPSHQAEQLIDRLRPWVPDHQTFSAGIALWDGVESAPELLQRADQALLQAKKAGRNRTMVAERERQATLPLKVA